MRSILAGCSLLAALVLPPAAIAGSAPPPSAAAEQQRAREIQESLEKIDGQLHRGEWVAAETAARSLVENAVLRKEPGTFDAVARLALAEAGRGKTEDAIWHWSVAQNLKVDFDPKPFGAPGEILASHPLRHLDEAPANLNLRRPGDGPFSPPRLVESKEVKLPPVWLSFPKGMRLQVVVDAQGRAREPVVAQSTTPALSYVVLNSLRDWRFEPARAGEPVAAFYEIQFPAPKPFSDLVDFKDSPFAESEAALRAGRPSEASNVTEKLWTKTRQSRNFIPSRGYLGVALALKALAEAGQGDADGAICRWQAAQTLEPHLYGVDLSAYGAAGKLLADHPWGESLISPQEAPWKKGGSTEKVKRPEALKRRQIEYPEYARANHMQGTVFVESTITTAGTLRNLLLLTRGAPPGLEADSLDTLCDWRFKPATYQGKPVPVHYTLTMNWW